jgi:hypothetical protein
MNISQQYRIDTSSFKPPVVHEYISIKELEKKYLKRPENEIDEIISKIFKEEVVNMKVGKELDDLILFIRNCKKYDYPQYLTDIKYFKDREIRKMMTNTNLLESLKNQNSPYTIDNEFNAKFKIQNAYQLKMGQKGQKIDSLVQNEFEKTTYEYLNYLCETPIIDKMNKLEEFNKKESSSKSNLLNILIEEEKEIDEANAKKNYLTYLKKMKKKNMIESYGVSLLENKTTYEDDIEDEYGLNNKQENEEKGQETESLIGDDSRSDTITIDQASYLKNGSLESYPYENMEDYDFHLLMEDESAMPESI